MNSYMEFIVSADIAILFFNVILVIECHSNKNEKESVFIHLVAEPQDKVAGQNVEALTPSIPKILIILRKL